MKPEKGENDHKSPCGRVLKIIKENKQLAWNGQITSMPEEVKP
jgi:hypothetical protein